VSSLVAHVRQMKQWWSTTRAVTGGRQDSELATNRCRGDENADTSAWRSFFSRWFSQTLV
jgi:hypothetical protein